jgi:hypothetical protein
MESTRCYDIAFIVGEIPNVPRICFCSSTPIQLDCKTKGEVLDNQQWQSEYLRRYRSTKHPHNWTGFDQQIEFQTVYEEDSGGFGVSWGGGDVGLYERYICLYEAE